MKIACIAQVKNESDIIESFIRKNSPLFDHFHIIDNDSSDNTFDILKKLSDEFSIVITRDYGDTYNQGEVITNVIRQLLIYREFDWFIPLDADEVVSVPRGILEEALEAVPENCVPKFIWRSQLPTETGFEPYELSGNPPVSKIGIDAKKALKNYFVIPGNHGIMTPDYEPVEEFDVGVRLDHFPVRTKDQIIRKVFATEQRHNRTHPDYRTHIHKIADYIRTRGSLGLPELRHIAAFYSYIFDGTPDNCALEMYNIEPPK